MPEAVIVVVPAALPGVTGTVAVLLPAAMFTLDGTVATLVLLLIRLTVSPLPVAGVESVIVKVPAAARFSGLGESVIPGALMVTVDGLLAAKPSFTINCTT